MTRRWLLWGIGLGSLAAAWAVFSSLGTAEAPPQVVPTEVTGPGAARGSTPDPEPEAEVAHTLGDQALRNLPDSTPEEQRLKGALAKRLQNPEARAYFDHTLATLGSGPGTVNAAQFVALTLSFEQSEELTQLMAANAQSLKEHSAELMATLEQHANAIDSNPYFHNRMLNLVHQLEVPVERKAAFYGQTITAPLVVKQDGQLEDQSLALDIALILARQDDAEASHVSPFVGAAIVANEGSPVAVEALRTRVMTYYPELAYLFR